MHSSPGKPEATKGYLRGSGLLLIGRFISLLTNFGVQVLSIRYLAKAQYGALAYALATVSTGTSVSLLGLPRAVNRFVPIFQEKRDYRSMFGTIFLATGTVLGFGLAIASLVFGFQGVLGDSIVGDPLSVGVLLALIGLVPIQALDNLFQGLAVVFIGARSLFYRRHILGPGLKLAAVLLVIAVQGDVYLLASCYLAVGAIGLANYLVLLYRALRKQGLLTGANLQRIRMPAREIFGFSIPLLSTDILLLLTLDVALAVLVLEHFRGPEEVAGLRAVASVAGLCVVFFDSLKFLFTPTASRLFARNATGEINDLYWQSSIWVTVFTFPVFAVCFFLSEPVTVLLFGAKYQGAGILLAWLAAGYYFNSALGMTLYLLQVYAKLRYIVAVNVGTALFGLIMTLWLVPIKGAVGAAAATTCTLVAYSIANYLGVLRGTGIGHWKLRYLKVYAVVLAAILALTLLQFAHPPIAVTAIAIAAASLALVRINNRVLRLEETFPFLKRLPGVGILLGKRAAMKVPEPAPEIRHHLEGHAPQYFPDFSADDDVKVELTRSMIRRYNWLYEYDLRTAARSHRVIVKVPLPVTAPLFRLEHAALSTIQEHFGQLGDDRFAPVSVFDLLPEHAAVVMESVARPTLRKVLQRSHRLNHPFRPPQLEGTFRNVGAWLRCFHGLPAIDELKERMAGREEYLSSIRESCRVLMKARIARRFLRKVLSLTETGARDVLPERFPLVLGHVDYGPHNIFVSPGGQVTVIDTLANRRVPMYKDLAYFLLLVKSMPIRSYSLGTLIDGAAVASWERAFLSGYFGQATVPLQAIRLFEIEACLRKWAERASTCRQSAGLKLIAKRMRMLLRNAFYRRHMKSLLIDVQHQEAASNGAAVIQRPVPLPAALKVHVVRPAEIEPGQLDVWRQLQAGAPWLDSPFLSPEYTLGVGAVRNDVEVAILEREGGTVGFLPFQRGPRNVGRPVGLRLSDLSGAVVRADVSWNPEEVIRACGLTSWHFGSTPADQQALQPYQLRTVQSPYITLSGGFQAYLEGRRRAGTELIQQARRKRRKMERELGPLRFEWRTTDQAAFDTLLRLKAEQRRRTNTVDALQSRWAIDLLDSLRNFRSDEFAGVLSALYLGDRVVAVHLGMRTRSVFHWWFPAFSPEFGDYSPGLILMLDLIQHCADSGMNRMDLGRGNERYKMSLMTDNMAIADGCVSVRLIDRIIQSAWFGMRALARSGPLRGPVKRSRSAFRRFLT